MALFRLDMFGSRNEYCLIKTCRSSGLWKGETDSSPCAIAESSPVMDVSATSFENYVG